MPIKFFLLGVGGLGFLGRGEWKCQFYFYGRGDFPSFEALPENQQKRTFQIVSLVFLNASNVLTTERICSA